MFFFSPPSLIIITINIHFFFSNIGKEKSKKDVFFVMFFVMITMKKPYFMA